MNEMNEQFYETSELQKPEEARQIERLSDAVSDYEVIGAEDAAGLGF